MRVTQGASLLLGAGWGAAAVVAYYVAFLAVLEAVLGPGQLTGTYVALQAMLAILVSMVMYAWRGPAAGVGALVTGFVPSLLFLLDRAGSMALPW